MVLLNQGEMLWQMAMNWKITPGRLAEWLYSWMKKRACTWKKGWYIYIGWFIPKTFRCFQQRPPQKTTMEWFPRSRKNRGTAVEKDPGTHLVQEIGQGGWDQNLSKSWEVLRLVGKTAGNHGFKAFFTITGLTKGQSCRFSIIQCWFLGLDRFL